MSLTYQCARPLDSAVSRPQGFSCAANTFAVLAHYGRGRYAVSDLRDARRSVAVFGSHRNQLVLCVFTTTPCVERITSAPTNQAEIVFRRCAATPSRTGVAANFIFMDLGGSSCCAQQPRNTQHHCTRCRRCRRCRCRRCRRCRCRRCRCRCHRCARSRACVRDMQLTA